MFWIQLLLPTSTAATLSTIMSCPVPQIAFSVGSLYSLLTQLLHSPPRSQGELFFVEIKSCHSPAQNILRFKVNRLRIRYQAFSMGLEALHELAFAWHSGFIFYQVPFIHSALLSQSHPHLMGFRCHVFHIQNVCSLALHSSLFRSLSSNDLLKMTSRVIVSKQAHTLSSVPRNHLLFCCLL